MKHTPSELRQEVYEFIVAHPLAALATVDRRNYPDLSMVYCLTRDDFTIYFSSRVEGKKFTNMLRQPEIALAFYDEASLTSIQIHGTAIRVEEIPLEQDILSELTKLHYGSKQWPTPAIQLFEQGASGELAVLRVTSHEMTMAKFDSKPGAIHDAPFFRHVI